MPEIIEDTELDTLSFAKSDKAVQNKARHYIDDDHLTKILSEWKKVFDANKAAGIERPRLPESVGEAIFDMAESMGKRHNFSGYSYLDEMKSDAQLHCVKYIHNFNPEKKSDKKGKVSAFGYINMIIWRSFTHRIEEEKQQQYLKYASFEQMGGMDAFQDDDMATASGDEGESGLAIGVLGADFIQKAREYEQKHKLGRAPKKEKRVEQLDTFMFDLQDSQESSEQSEVELDSDLELEFE